jgi:Arc/MetJ family transcription regulator
MQRGRGKRPGLTAFQDVPSSRSGTVYTSMCILVCVSRTNIELDDELIERAMRLFHLKTKREAVQFALLRLVGSGPMGVEEQLTCRGMGWGDEAEDAQLADARAPRFPEWDAYVAG